MVLTSETRAHSNSARISGTSFIDRMKAPRRAFKVSLTGVYVLEGKPSDVILCLVMGILGYVMIRFDYPRLTLVIALVLGETAERSYHQTLIISDHEMLSFILGRPAATIILVATILTLFLPIMRKVMARRAQARAAG